MFEYVTCLYVTTSFSKVLLKPRMYLLANKASFEFIGQFVLRLTYSRSLCFLLLRKMLSRFSTSCWYFSDFTPIVFFCLLFLHVFVIDLLPLFFKFLFLQWFQHVQNISVFISKISNVFICDWNRIFQF